MQNVVGLTLVAIGTKFGLGAEIQSPTGLFHLSVAMCLLTGEKLRAVTVVQNVV